MATDEPVNQLAYPKSLPTTVVPTLPDAASPGTRRNRTERRQTRRTASEKWITHPRLRGEKILHRMRVRSSADCVTGGVARSGPHLGTYIALQR